MYVMSLIWIEMAQTVIHIVMTIYKVSYHSMTVTVRGKALQLPTDMI